MISTEYTIFSAKNFTNLKSFSPNRNASEKKKDTGVEFGPKRPTSKHKTTPRAVYIIQKICLEN